MKIGPHLVEPIPFPGDANGYLHPSGTPGTLCGFFVPGIQVYRCTQCEEMFQPVGDDRYSAPPEDFSRVRVSYGSTSLELLSSQGCP